MWYEPLTEEQLAKLRKAGPMVNTLLQERDNLRKEIESLQGEVAHLKRLSSFAREQRDTLADEMAALLQRHGYFRMPQAGG